MKFSPTWQQLALLAILLAAPALTQRFAPGVESAVAAMVSTVFGALFVNLREAMKQDGPPPGGKQ